MRSCVHLTKGHVACMRDRFSETKRNKEDLGERRLRETGERIYPVDKNDPMRKYVEYLSSLRRGG